MHRGNSSTEPAGSPLMMIVHLMRMTLMAIMPFVMTILLTIKISLMMKMTMTTMMMMMMTMIMIIVTMVMVMTNKYNAFNDDVVAA